jgi:RNA polymerase sigma-70 factor (ECF subfamily)
VWPSLHVDERAFAARLTSLTPEGTDPARAVEAMHGADFYLACACVAGEPAALAELDRLISSARASVEKVLGASAGVDDALQRVRRKVATDLDGPARIAEYSGRGPLKRWIRAVATRAALDAKRTQKDHEPLREEDSDSLAQVISSPELALLKDKDRPRFEAAFAEALASLGARERNALRLQVVDGLSLDAIGRAYGVNKSTVSRWLVQARADVLRHLRRTLEKDLRLQGRELQSFIGLFQSRLDASISAFLGRGGHPP